MRILGISGSLRAASSNTRLLTAALRLAPPEMAMSLTSSLGELPPFNPDVEVSRVPAVDRWVEEMREAEGVVVSTPEYAGGYPGALKNALDWLVATDAFVRKPFTLLNASSRSVRAQGTLVTVLETMSGVYVESASATIPLLGGRMTSEEIVTNPEFAKRLSDSLATFAAEVKRLADERPS